MNRRAFIGASPLVLLAACSGGNPFTNKTTIDLATAKQWANLLDASFDGFVISTIATLPVSAQAGIKEANSLLDSANAQIQGLADGSVDAKAIVASLVKVAQGLLVSLQPYVPALAVTSPLFAEIEAGFVVLSAFVTALAITPPAAPADATHLKAAAARGMALKAMRH